MVSILLNKTQAPERTSKCTIRAMLHDSRVYADPHRFNPARFLKETPDPDPRKFIFGFGRRTCPGVHVANNGTWLTCAGLLAAFDITPSPELMSRVDAIGGKHSPELYALFEPFGVRFVRLTNMAENILNLCFCTSALDRYRLAAQSRPEIQTSLKNCSCRS